MSIRFRCCPPLVVKVDGVVYIFLDFFVVSQVSRSGPADNFATLNLLNQSIHQTFSQSINHLSINENT